MHVKVLFKEAKMYYQFEQELKNIQKNIQDNEKYNAEDKVRMFGDKLKLADLCTRIYFEREKLLREQKETTDAEKLQKLKEQTANLDQFIEENKLREKRDEAFEYIRKTSPMYKKLYESGARLGIDYIVIPDGAAYHYPATSINPKQDRCFLDYKQLGYEKGNPCKNYNSGACVVFDGEDLILTCDYSLYESLTESCNYETRGGIPFYNGGQEMYFDSVSLEKQFEEMIKQTKGNHYQRVPLGLGDQRSYKDEMHWKLLRQKGHNEKGFHGPRKRRSLPTGDNVLALLISQNNSHNY